MIIFAALVDIEAWALAGLGAVLEANAPDVDGNLTVSAVSSLGAGVLWILGKFKFWFGLEIIIAAYTTRFLIRRIPVIG